MPDVNKHFPSDEAMIQLITLIKNAIMTSITAAIASDIDEGSDNQHAAGAKAVFDLINETLAAMVKLEIEIVEELPETGDTHTIYLLPDPDGSPGEYEQWMYKNGAWIQIGNTAIDLSGYWSKEELVPMTAADVTELWAEV
ncbi:MAG: hypothetical protein FWE80_08305 [Oscillospiraceae bacterium]|nr:hypothetical protein [Oscillospiraceae bacterium]